MTGGTATTLPTTLPPEPGGSGGGGTGGMDGPGGGAAVDPDMNNTGGDGSMGDAGSPSEPPSSEPPPSDLPPNPSGLPEPGDGGEARPAGTPGNLTVLPWAGFSGAISYSFDDNNASQTDNAGQLLGLGVPFTWYLWTSKSGGSASAQLFHDALAAGHEIGNHTASHATAGNDQNDVNQAQQFILDTFQVTAFTMAAPNGYVDRYEGFGPSMFILDRDVQDALIGPDDNVNMMRLPTYIPPTGAGTQQFNPKVDAAVSQGKWQTVCIHGFDGDGSAYQPISLSGFVQHIEYAKTQDVWIGTMMNVGAYFLGRKLLSDVAPQTDGDGQVWTWTLPDVFPPNQYVRVTVDGGTLSQDGTPLPWNEHGYYEVALDVGSLTLSP